ncbi:putative transcription factor interactor and regulator CCHC(Zn) family [Rosa chinensis]|uniref:Putative transcription factor interactor and regulator CCHC(Zn) family n=1 Tax=Rosa chinensis TaxID=74649 RepID=A0A2P6R5V4_ROSCH|nr:putative transcription factor interactor and regulator CCHC(Zn) family [Rosa chinensis]
MAGLFAGRGNSRPPGNFGNRNFNYAGRGIASPVIVGFNSNNAIGAQNNFTGFRNNIANPGAGPLTCQLCGKVGHGAKTCRTLSNYQQGNNNYSTTGCQYCGRQGHTAERCYFIIGFPGQQQQQSSEPVNGTAMLAASNLAPQFWLADTGATNHMTSNAQLIDNAVSYPATDTVQVGNGNHLKITHSGSTTLGPLLLDNVLLIPELAAHLLSIYQLCKQNNCSVWFDEFMCVIQDKVQGRILYQGMCKQGLYPIPFQLPLMTRTNLIK